MKNSLILVCVCFAIVGCQRPKSSDDNAGADNTSQETPSPAQPVAALPAPTPGPVPSPTPKPPTPKPKPASISIEGGLQITSAADVRLELKTIQGWKMKISENNNCQGGTWEPYATQKLWTLKSQNAKVSISVVFQDYDGGSTGCAVSSIVHDSLGPVIAIELDPKNALTAGTTTTAFLSVEDPSSGLQAVSCQINGSGWPCSLNADGKATLSFPSQNAGGYQLSVQATDRLGNKSNQVSSWTVKTTLKHISQSASIKSQNKVDILMITDNSGSMGYEQKSMAKRMGTFVSKLQGLDWKIGITTTDPRNVTLGDGRLVPMKNLTNTYSISSSMNPNTAQQILGATIQRSEVGHDQEQGIFVTYRAIERSMMTSDPTNANFLRPDAAFAAVVISDEDESATGPKNKPENLLNFVETTYKGNKKFVFHSIITKPGDTACQKQQGFNFGTVYAKMSTLTGAGSVGGAIIGSVCESDYAGQLSGIGQSIQDMKRTIDLQCTPIGNSNSSVLVNLGAKPYNERYEVQGAKITFEKPLPAGDYKLNYDCL